MRMLFVCGYEISNRRLKTASWIQSIIEGMNSTHQIILVGEGYLKWKCKRTTINGKEILPYKFRLKDFYNEFREILNQKKPDAVIIFGTEGKLACAALNACIEENFGTHTAVFAQGFCIACANHYAEGIPKSVINRYTFRDFLRRDRIKDQIKSFLIRAKSEQKVLEKVQHFIGRTTMDKALLMCFNNTALYYKCNDILRSSFYQDEWEFDKCEKHRIFVSQYYYPLKGFHILIEALSVVVKRFPDLVVAVAGYNPINKGFSKKELKDSSYIRYLKKLVVKYNLQNNILLLGMLNEFEMKNQYLSANVFVMPSLIENSPNSLAEAMLLGVPTVASDVGGVTDFAKHMEETYIYPSTDSCLLAHYIMEIFEDTEKTKAMGKASRKRALLDFDRKKNIETFEEICEKIAQN